MWAYIDQARIDFFSLGYTQNSNPQKLKLLTCETIVKNYSPNSFRDTNILETLKGVDVKRLVICGMMTHVSTHIRL